MQKEIYKKIIKQFVKDICPLEKAGALNFVERFCVLAPQYPLLAADILLKKELAGKFTKIINQIIKQISLDENNCRALFEVIFNLIGLESKRIGLSKIEKERSLQIIKGLLKKWGAAERGKLILEKTVQNIIQEMKRILAGKSMAAKMAENIEAAVDKNRLIESFIGAVKNEIADNVYYKMTDQEFSKFGNDSATGLKIVRHFDYVQVSSNPVIAARAYEEFPELWDSFKKIVQLNPDWRKNPKKYTDEITLYATLNSLLPNLLVFRPIALLSNFHDGLVSYQLNPLLAENVAASVKDVQRICSILKDILYYYDKWSGWETDGRPNIVFKVASSSPAAIEITRKLNEINIGTNNTVTYSVSQEITLLLTEAEGMAKAAQKGLLPSQVYQTNMIGRTEDHLRESEAEKLVNNLNEQSFKKLIKAMMGDAKGSREELTKIVCAKKYLKTLADEKFVAVFGLKMKEKLIELEEAIELSGIFVTRRVYKIFFNNKVKILNWLKKDFNLAPAQTRKIFDRIDLLPASKRRARDTYLVLGTPNITNTEFPDQQLKVYLEAQKPDFNLNKFRDSINQKDSPKLVDRLLKIEDFRKIYELTPELANKLSKIGIKGAYGLGGMEPSDWSKYGAVVKTMNEFCTAYRDFQDKILTNFKLE